MNSSSVDFEIMIWVEGENAKKRLSVTSIYLTKIYGLLYRYGISIPFPQMDIHLKRAHAKPAQEELMS